MSFILGYTNVLATQVSVDTTSGGKKLTSVPGKATPVTVTLLNPSATAVYFGPKGVATTTGFLLPQNVPVTVTVAQDLYGTIATSTQTIYVLQVF